MIEITPRTRVAELLAGPPALVETLKSTGLYRDGDDPQVMLGQLCWSFGFSPGILVMMLQSVKLPAESPPLDATPFRAMPLAALVDHIEEAHHGYLRRALPHLTQLTGAAARRAPADARLAELHEEMSRFAVELEAHLAHEEEALFPMARDLGAGTAVAPTRCGGSVGGPIACMENEHEQATRTLGRLRELTDGYAAAGDGHAGLLEALAEFDRDLREHMYKEDEVLFPRALAAQQGARAGALG